MLKREVQAQPGEDFQDLLGNPKSNYDSYAKVRSDASVAWSLDKWTTTLYANYIGHTPNYLAGLNGYEYTHASGYKAGKWGSYTTYNLSVNYRAQDDLTLSLMVNNVFNKMPEQQAQLPGHLRHAVQQLPVQRLRSHRVRAGQVRLRQVSVVFRV